MDNRTNTKEEWTDLGLSVKWASCNLGAGKPEDHGDYYAWGETSAKDEYNTGNSLTYGKSLEELQRSGILDANANLTADYDAAQKLGKGRMPTRTEFDELRTECCWEWTAQNGANGMKVTGPNGRSIFLPAAGCRHEKDGKFAGSIGIYRSSSMVEDESTANVGACYIFFDERNIDASRDGYRQFFGFSVRPVIGSEE